MTLAAPLPARSPQAYKRAAGDDAARARRGLLISMKIIKRHHIDRFRRDLLRAKPER